jgi:hypothetical protein
VGLVKKETEGNEKSEALDEWVSKLDSWNIYLYQPHVALVFSATKSHESSFSSKREALFLFI